MTSTRRDRNVEAARPAAKGRLEPDEPHEEQPMTRTLEATEPDLGTPDARSRLLERTARQAAAFLSSLGERPVGATASADELREALGGPLPDGPAEDTEVLDGLVDAAERGVVGIPSGRYFGFVIGGALPAALAADWLTSTWDQNAGLFVGGPTASVVEEIAGGWIAELLGLPETASVGFVTGCQMAHVTGLAAARHDVLRRAGWDLARDGLQGAPRLRVVVGAERHVTVDRALRFLGIGSSQIVAVGSDDQGRMRADELADALRGDDAPTIVCAQSGNVNTGSFDELDEIADAAAAAGAWLHVDGAFGLWAGASPAFRHLVRGVERADSWATDAHKWLNVPYDSGLVFCAHPEAHRAAMSVTASYLVQAEPGAERDQVDWTPEFSRRARGFPVYAALRSLGRSGVAELVERCCAHARRFAERLEAEDGVEVLNDVVLNQVLVRFRDDDDVTRAVVLAVQEDGTCWLGGTTWQGRAAMRISVSNWRTTAEDVERSADAILRLARRQD
jgi:glutamate/tyrosine decarboxylase-like PLP-dependent enzyme